MERYVWLRNMRLILEWMTFIGLVALIAMFAVTAGIAPLPPPHLYADGGGLVATYGMRPVLLLLFLVACAVIAVLFLVSRFPRLYRYPVRITAKNVEIQYLLAKIMLGMAQLICAVYFCILILLVYQMQIGLFTPRFWFITIVSISALLIDVLIYVAAAGRNK